MSDPRFSLFYEDDLARCCEAVREHESLCTPPPGCLVIMGSSPSRSLILETSIKVFRNKDLQFLARLCAL